MSLVAVGCGDSPSGVADASMPEGDAALRDGDAALPDGAMALPPLPLLDGASVFTGDLHVACTSEGVREAIIAVQAQLILDDQHLTGRMWAQARADEGVAVIESVGVGGSVGFSPSVLGSGNHAVSELELEGLHEADGALVASGRGRYLLTGHDISEECPAAMTLRLSPDTAPPAAVLVGAPLHRDPIMLAFDEVVAREPLAVSISDEHAQPVDVSIEPVVTFDGDQVGSLRIVPSLPWPEGEVVVTTEGARDLAGNHTARSRLTFSIPRYVSVSEDPSFERAERDVWFTGGSCGWHHAFMGFDRETSERVDVAPRDGDWLVVCGDRELRGFLVPPSGTTRASIDVGNQDRSVDAAGAEFITVEITCGEQVFPLTPEGDPPPPAFVTYSGPLTSSGPCWIDVRYDVAVHEDGKTDGEFFVDHLRFE